MHPPSRRELLLGLAGVALAGCAASAARPAPPPPSRTAPPTRPADPAAPAGPARPAAEVVHGPRTRPRAALTFHGSGDPALARALLSEAERAGARITVFAVGQWLEEHPELARRVLDGGHGLANHTWSHPSDLRTSPRAVLDVQVRRAAAVLRRLTGSDGGYFRPSAMDRATPAVLAAAGAAGYRTVVAYDVDPRDYTDPGAAAVVRRTLAGVRPGSIVSLHLGHAGTVAALPAILDGLRGRRLAPVPVGELLHP